MESTQTALPPRRFLGVLGMLFGLILSFPVMAADPVIHVAWGEPLPPVLGLHYNVSTVSPASVDFPGVELISGNMTWRVWSTDTDNPGGIGDIGTITCPVADNFGVRIEDASGGAGARDVKGITLVPSSSSNHSNITVARISGDLQNDLTVLADFSGVGGEVDELHIGGDVTGDITIHKLNNEMGVAADRTVSGTVVIDQLDGLLTFAFLTGELNLGTVYGGIRLFQPIEGSLTVSKMESTSVVFFPSGISPTGVVTFDELNRVALSGVGCAANSHG